MNSAPVFLLVEPSPIPLAILHAWPYQGTILETYSKRVASCGNLAFVLSLPDLDSPRLPSGIRITLFHIAQEKNSLVLKYAKAIQLTISLQEQDDRVRLKVEGVHQSFELSGSISKRGTILGVELPKGEYSSNSSLGKVCG